MFDTYFLKSLCDSFDTDSNISPFLCAMGKDPRYTTVNKLITSNQLHSFSDILAIVPKTVITRDLGMHHITFNKLINHPAGFTLDNIYDIASLVGVENKVMLLLFYNETGEKKAKRKK
jgi:hypothetical protein